MTEAEHVKLVMAVEAAVLRILQEKFTMVGCLKIVEQWDREKVPLADRLNRVLDYLTEIS